METDLLPTKKVAAVLKVSTITVQSLSSRKRGWGRTGKITMANTGSWQGLGLVRLGQAKKTDLDWWYEGKFLESTVFQ